MSSNAPCSCSAAARTPWSCCTWHARRFAPAAVPFRLMHVDTGHNFAEVLSIAMPWSPNSGLRLVVASVQDGSIVVGSKRRPDGTRNPLQTVPLLEGIAPGKFDAVFGGGRRDEEKARAKERVFSLRDEFGQWDPRRQRPELWDLYNGRTARVSTCGCSRCRTGPKLTSGATSSAKDRTCRSIYFSHEREVFLRDGMWLPPGHGAAHERARNWSPSPCGTGQSVTCPAPAPSNPMPDSCRRHRRGRQQVASPNAAPPAPTTACPRPPWKTASARDTSNDPRSTPPGHRRVRRRRKVDSSGPAALRHQVSPADQIAGDRAREPRARDARAPTSHCLPMACAPSANKASRSTSPTATSPPPPGRSSSPTPLATCSTRATW